MGQAIVGGVNDDAVGSEYLATTGGERRDVGAIGREAGIDEEIADVEEIEQRGLGAAGQEVGGVVVLGCAAVEGVDEVDVAGELDRVVPLDVEEPEEHGAAVDKDRLDVCL